MKIISLAYGEEAPELEDRIRITKAGPKAWRWGGNVAYRMEVVFKDCPDYYSSREAAEGDAIEWASANGSQTLYIEIDDA